MKNYNIAVCGATGVVGKEMIEILVQKKFPFSKIKPLASKKSHGEYIEINEEEVMIEELTESSFEDIDIALFATSSELSAKFVPIAVKAGAICIDNSSNFRLDPKVPLVVPEVNKDLIKENKIIANPNCSTIQLVVVLDELRKVSELKRIVVSTYQAVSGAGKDALDELWDQTQSVFTQKHKDSKVFNHKIAFNCIPQIDVILESGYTKEEMKLINESSKILNLPNLKLTATAVRVPVFHSHAESVNIEFEKKVSIKNLIEVLKSNKSISVYENYEDYPLQADVSGSDQVHVGRIREDVSLDSGVNLWIVADNIRKGAALNAVQIAQCLI